MSLEMAHKVIVPQKKIMARSFLNSGTLIVIKAVFNVRQFVDAYSNLVTFSITAANMLDLSLFVVKLFSV
jgi:hypothetical protein